MNDCWPVVSWSSIDYLGNWKALHYQIKRSFENQVILTEEKDGILNFYLINDGLYTYKDVRLEIQVIKFNGEIIKQHEINFLGKDLESILKSDPVKVQDLLQNLNKNEAYLKLELWTGNGIRLSKNHYFFSKPKELKLTKPKIKIQKVSSFQIQVSTDVYAKDVYLMGDNHFSDNFFDLFPNDSKIITFSKPMDNFEVMSLWDTMNN